LFISFISIVIIFFFIVIKPHFVNFVFENHQNFLLC